MARKSANSKVKQRGKNAVRGNPDKIKGQGFHTNPERINTKGRPRKLVHEFNAGMKAEGFEPVKESQLIDAYETLLQLPEDKLKALQNDKAQPLFLRRVAEWLAHKEKGMQMLEKLLDRAHGKAMMRASAEVNVKTEQPLFPDVVVTNQASTEEEGEGD